MRLVKEVSGQFLITYHSHLSRNDAQNELLDVRSWQNHQGEGLVDETNDAVSDKESSNSCSLAAKQHKEHIYYLKRDERATEYSNMEW